MKKTLVAAAFVSGALSSSAALAEDQPLIVRQPHQCGTEQINRTGFDWDPRAASFSGPREIRTIYLNSKGATYEAGSFPTNAMMGRVNGSIIQSSGTVTIPPISNVFNWPKISTCVKQHFERFNVRIVETKPTSGNFIEAVVGGDGSEIGRGGGGGLLGIAAADNFCGITEGGIAFSFSEAHNIREIMRKDDELCATIAHEIGHLVTLEHETLPTDVMSYVFIDDSGTKAFNDQMSQCGTTPEQPMQSCTCGGTMTSSGMKLAQFIGLRPVETTPPTLAIKSPGDGNIGATFEVVATASDDSGIDSVTVYLNDVEKGSVSEPVNGEYKVMVAGVAEGMYTLKVVATDGANNTTEQTRAVNVVKLATGETCVANDACKGGICAQSPDGNFCTESCNLEADACPDGFACEAIGAQSVCVISEDGGGCCSASPNVGAAGMLSLLVGFVLFGRRRRR